MFAFEGSIVAIGIIGGIANLLMLLILAQTKARKYEMSIVFNQMSLDFLCCLLLVISNVTKILDINYSIIIGRALCKILTGEAILWFFLTSSTANLVILTLERYVKIVHAVFHKRHFRQWMYFLAIVLSWANPITVLGAFVDLSATNVKDGQCILYVEFPAAINAKAYAVYRFLMNFVLPLVVFAFCYSRILQVIQKSVVPVNLNMMNSAAEQKAMKTQMNIIKTFLIISVCFFFCWCPTRLYYFLYNLRIATDLSSHGRNVTVFLAFLNVCLNPFIYAAKLDPVKQYLLRLKIFSRGRTQERVETVVSVINPVGESAAVQMGNHA